MYTISSYIPAPSSLPYLSPSPLPSTLLSLSPYPPSLPLPPSFLLHSSFRLLDILANCKDKSGLSGTVLISGRRNPPTYKCWICCAGNHCNLRIYTL